MDRTVSSTAYTTMEHTGFGLGWHLERIVATRERQTATIPIELSSSTAIRTALRVVLPVEAGDLLHLGGRLRLTNDVTGTKYQVGCPAWFDGYDCDDGLPYSEKTWLRAAYAYDAEPGGLTGDNVDPSGGPAGRHHMPLVLGPDVWEVPVDWPAGHRLCLAIRVSAASTKAEINGGNDVIKLDDGYNSLVVQRWVPIS